MAITAMEPVAYTIADAARAIGMSKRTLEREIAAKRIEVSKPTSSGRTTLITPAALRDYVARGQEAAAGT